MGDEWRLRYERYQNNEWGGARKPDEHYWGVRLLPYAVRGGTPIVSPWAPGEIASR